MRRCTYITILLSLPFLVGCRAGSWNQNVGSLSLRSATLTPHLIFDSIPGATWASDLQPRSHWPFASSGRLLRETVDYVERFEDRQGRGFRGQADFYRRATTIRRRSLER